MLSHCSKDELINLRRALNAIPPPLPACTYSDVAAQLSASGVRPPIASSVEKTLKEDFDLEKWRSAVDFAIFKKLESYQAICLIIALGAGLLTAITYLLALERGGGMYVVFTGGIIGGFMGVGRFSAEKKSYVGNESNFQEVERLGLDFRRTESNSNDPY